MTTTERRRQATAMACPKDAWTGPVRRRRPPRPLAELSPAERKAMRQIAASADLLDVDGQLYLLAPVSPRTLDALAAFEAEFTDLEDDGDAEPSIGWATPVLGGDILIGPADDAEFDMADQELEPDLEPDYRRGARTAGELAARARRIGR